jgi:hypothetical protein
MITPSFRPYLSSSRFPNVPRSKAPALIISRNRSFPLSPSAFSEAHFGSPIRGIDIGHPDFRAIEPEGVAIHNAGHPYQALQIPNCFEIFPPLAPAGIRLCAPKPTPPINARPTAAIFNGSTRQPDCFTVWNFKIFVTSFPCLGL